jgi:multiple sugar transport system permease protein
MSPRRLGVALLIPALVLLGLVTVFPIGWVVTLSLQRRVPVFGIAEFVGLRNFGFLIGDNAFWNAARVTAVFTVVSVALEVALGLALALALHGQRRARPAALALLLLPWCLPGVVTARTWEWLYHPTAGLVNRLLAPVIGTEINWLGDPGTALGALIVADVWRMTPFVGLLLYARRSGIPPAVYEAAAMDGAGTWAVFRAITLPLLGPVLLVATLFRTLDAIRAFDLMFVLTGGGPAATTETFTVLAYRQLFQTLQLGVGAAVAVVVFVLVVAMAWIHLRAGERVEART